MTGPQGTRATSTADASVRALLAARAADENHATEVVVLDVGDIISITEFFVLASASNVRLVRSIVEDIESAVKDAGFDGPRAIEGRDDASWVLMDFGDFIVHVFLAETREFYDLDRLWSDAPPVEWDERAARVARGT